MSLRLEQLLAIATSAGKFVQVTGSLRLLKVDHMTKTLG